MNTSAPLTPQDIDRLARRRAGMLAQWLRKELAGG